MKAQTQRLGLPATVLFLMFFLSGCFIEISPAPGFAAYDFQYQTNFVSNQTGKYIICNNLTTNLTYSFKYRGFQPTSWVSQLRGKETQQTKSRVNLTPSSQFVGTMGSNGYWVNYQINPDGAPRFEEPTLTTQGINVTPTGATILELTVYGVGIDYQLSNPPEIPIVENC